MANGFAWWKQPEDPKIPWEKTVLASNEVGATNIHPVDVDRDGIMDLFATRGHGQGVLVFHGKGNAIFEQVDVDPMIEGPHCLVTTDLDEDGDVDAATCSRTDTGETVWYENISTPQQIAYRRHQLDQAQAAYDIRAVDPDGDTDLDLLIGGHGSRNIVWYENPR